ncbi:DUF1360 domain-containing protein, partial [Kineococcus glutinatus]|uniref:DUF1360 domain-containing protein n=1 Tax=Kineococcus glutinatus TaxID=1070872 RepID=UPI0031E65AC1
MKAGSALSAAHERLHALQRDYEGSGGEGRGEDVEERPLGGFLALVGVYGGAVGAAALWGRARGVRLPERIGAQDLALLTVAAHEASRLITKDAVTSPFRAPFTRHTGSAGEGEVQEEVRGSGLRHAVGELVTCPFCTSMWTATGLVAGSVLAPRLTRTAAATLAAVFGSNVLHLLYDSAKH